MLNVDAVAGRRLEPIPGHIFLFVPTSGYDENGVGNVRTGCVP